MTTHGPYNTYCSRIARELASRADQIVLRWFWHMETMDEYRMARRVSMAGVNGGRVRGRPRLDWMDGVKVALGSRGMTVESYGRCRVPHSLLIQSSLLGCDYT